MQSPRSFHNKKQQTTRKEIAQPKPESNNEVGEIGFEEPAPLGIISPTQLLQFQRIEGNSALQRRLNIGGSSHKNTNLPNGFINPKRLSNTSHIAQRSAFNVAAIQRAMQSAEIKGNAHLRGGDSTPAFTDGINSKTYTKVNENSVIGHKMKKGFAIQYDPNDIGFTKEKKMGEGGWYKAQADDYEGWIRATKIKAPSGGTPAPIKEDQKKMKQWSGTRPGDLEAESEFDTIEDPLHLGTTLDGVEGVLGQRADSLDLEKLKEFKGGKLQDRANKDSKVEQEKNVVDTVAGGMQGIVGIISVAGAIKGLIEGKPTEKIAAAFLGIDGLAKISAGITKSIDAGTKAAGNSSRSDGDGLDLGGKMTGAIADVAGGLKSLVETGIQIFQQIRKANKMDGSAHIKGVMEIVTGLLNVAQSGVKAAKGFLDYAGGAITPSLMQAIPGLGIAISAATIGIKAFNFAKAWIQSGPITQLKREFEKDSDFSNFVTTETKSKWYNKKKTKTVRKINKADAKARLAELRGKTPATMSAAEQKELRTLQEWELTREMKKINTKRQVRASIQIGNELIKIGGEIATLSGVGATVGVGMKAVATVSEIGMTAFRRLKQFGRDREWWGRDRPDKTTEGKHKKRLEHTSLLFKMASELPHPPRQQHTSQYKRVQNLFVATGVDMTMLQSYSDKAKHQKMYELVYQAMKARE